MLAVVTAAIVLRRPDALFAAQFWAEDGMVWFSEAYAQGGFAAALHPQNGYFQTVSRVAAWVATMVPMVWAPVVTNMVALVVQVLPVALLWSRRWDTVVPSVTVRLILTLWYVVLPNMGEVHGNITNTHWFLSFYMVLILASPVARSGATRIHDAFFVLLSGLSGPFSIVIAPIAVMIAWQRRMSSRFPAILAGVVCATAAVQTASVMFTMDVGRSHAPLGASIQVLIALLGAKIFAPLVGGHDAVRETFRTLPLAALAAAVGSTIVGLALWRGPAVLRAIIVFACLTLSAALASPIVSIDGAQWPLMGTSWRTGSRYFVMPMVTVVASCVWVFADAVRRSRFGLAIVMGILILIGIGIGIGEYHISPYKDLQWRQHAAACQQQPVGTTCEIPINPGKPWYVRIAR